MSDDKKDPLAIYSTLGLNISQMSGKQILCVCPFCSKNKFYIDPERTVFDCKACGTTGNSVSFIDHMFRKVYQPALTGDDLSEIVKTRTKDGKHLPQEAYELDQFLGKNDDLFTWVVRKPNGQPLGLRTWNPKPDKKGKKHAVRQLAGCELGILGADQLLDKRYIDEPIYITEGEWDRIAMVWLLYYTEEPGIVVSVPGAGNFKKDWADWFAGRDVVGLYDNDIAGRAGTVKAHKFLTGVAKSLKFIHWDETKPDGYDIDDLAKDKVEKPENAIAYINAKLQKVPTGEPENASHGILSEDTDREKEQMSLEAISVDELHTVFKKWLKLDNCDLLDVAMACVWSINLPGNPLWMFVVAPPSGSKSETIMPLSEYWKVHAISSVTSKALVSGFPIKSGADPSLFASLEGKKAVIAVKDLTPLLQGNEQERDETFGILRDAYDGSLTKVFGNGEKRIYKDLHFTILAGVTPAIDSMSNTSMGERFLKFRADRDTDREDDLDRAIRAIENCGTEVEMRTELRMAAVKSLVREYDYSKVPQPDETFTSFTAKLAYVCANIRAVAPTDRGSDIQSVSPMSEAPPRLAIQFTKLAQSLAIHYGDTDLNSERILRLMRRVAAHTPNTIPTKVIQCLSYFGESNITDLSQRITSVGRETITRVCTAYARIGVLKVIKPIGQPTVYRINSTMTKYIEETAIYRNLPASDVLYRKDEPKKTVARPGVLTIKKKP